VMVESIPGDPPDLFNPPPGCRFSERCEHAVKGLCDCKEPTLVDMGGEHFVACHLRGGNQ